MPGCQIGRKATIRQTSLVDALKGEGIFVVFVIVCKLMVKNIQPTVIGRRHPGSCDSAMELNYLN